MPAGKLNLKIEQGATFRRVLTWKDAKGRPVNLTGYTAKLQLRATLASAVLLELSTENGRISLGTTDGKITLSVPDEVTDTLTFTTAVYDLKIYAPNGDEIRLVEGKITVSPAVTKDA